ncbi:MAG: DUF962 domain-containing protein [Bacteroidota bacterium]|nr:DUF962 domain-containing protein [Bacteroidota bacterium]
MEKSSSTRYALDINSRLVFMGNHPSDIDKKHTSLSSFYLYYLYEHRHPANRILHYIGTSGIIALLILSILWQYWILLAFIPLVGYGFAWIGHGLIERNKPATFTYPFYSLASDFIMYFHWITRRLSGQLEVMEKHYGLSNKN